MLMLILKPIHARLRARSHAHSHADADAYADPDTLPHPRQPAAARQALALYRCDCSTPTQTHARTHARARAHALTMTLMLTLIRTHSRTCARARTHARTHARKHAPTHTHIPSVSSTSRLAARLRPRRIQQIFMHILHVLKMGFFPSKIMIYIYIYYMYRNMLAIMLALRLAAGGAGRGGRIPPADPDTHTHARAHAPTRAHIPSVGAFPHCKEGEALLCSSGRAATSVASWVRTLTVAAGGAGRGGRLPPAGAARRGLRVRGLPLLPQGAIF